MFTKPIHWRYLLVIPLLTLIGCSSPQKTSLKAYPNNPSIQQIADKAVSDARKDINPKAVVLVVAEPSTGKILAMSGWKQDTKPELKRERSWPCWLMLEAGSTFKPVVVAAALEKGKITPTAKIFCENGLFTYGGKTIKDHYRLGDLTYDEILAKSSNIGASKISLLLKDGDFYCYVRKFGFGKKTGISIPYETGGLVPPPEKWEKLTKTRMAFGQCVLVTPIQLTMAYCALCNGGKLMRPVTGNEKPKVVCRVCSEKTADMVKNALSKVANPDGTAPLAKVKGVTVGGKTGTAQIIGKNGAYLTNKYWTMFSGFFPVDHPKYVITVVVQDADFPPEKNFGGLVAAPIFSEVATKISALKKGNAGR
jgi:cell division protein FtsI/penicillin-binding protein 2